MGRSYHGKYCMLHSNQAWENTLSDEREQDIHSTKFRADECWVISLTNGSNDPRHMWENRQAYIQNLGPH